MLGRIELGTKVFTIVMSDMLSGCHARDVPGAVVAPGMVQMMPMLTVTVGIDTMTKIPFIREPMRRRVVPIDWLINHLVAAK